MKAPACIFIIACAMLLVLVRGQTLKKVIGQIKAGTEAGNDIIGILSNEQFTYSLSVITKKFGPFLGAVGPVLSLVNAVLPVQPSKELIFMKKKFSEMDAKLDRVFNQFGDVKNLLTETSLKSQYGTYEQKINGLSYRLRLMLEATPNASIGQKNNFIESYKSSYHNSAYNLWRGMMESNMVLTNNIPKTAMPYTKYDRKRMQHFMKGITQLIMQGAKVHLAYLIAVGRHHSYEGEKNQWEEKLKQLIGHIDAVDRQVKYGYHAQSRKDIINLAAIHKGSKHWPFSNTVFSFLSNKYFWRDWFVVVYNPIWGGRNHWVKVCSGHILFRTHGRNIVVASVDKSKRHIDTAYAGQIIRSISTTSWSLWHGDRRKDARNIYENELPNKFTNGCTYAGAGVIVSNAQPAYRGPKDRMTYRRTWKGHYNVHAFG